MMDWLDLLGSPRDSQESSPTPQFKASILWHSAFFIVQLSQLYMTTEKIIALTRWIFVGKVMSLLFNMLSTLVITFLPRRKCLLISWLQSLSAVILEPRKIKSATVTCWELPGCTQSVTRSWDERGTCKAALPLEVVPGAWCVPFFLLYYCCWAFY